MSKFPYSGLDYSIGILLCITSLTGIIMNSVAFVYFKSATKRNRNGKFFKRLYSVISLNDIFICLGVFPAIEAAFSSDREGVLFTNSAFCSGWFVYWFTIYYLSMILIAALSISRLCLIMSPKSYLTPWVSYAICGGFAVVIFTFWATLSAVHLVYPTYYPEHMFCGFASFSNSNTSLLYNSGLTAKFILVAINGVSVACFFTVCITFVLSLVYLQRFIKAASVQGVSKRPRIAAAKTVILVTFLYILFNVPIMSITLYMVGDRIINPEPDDATIEYMIWRNNTHLFKSVTFLNQYAMALCFALGTSLNSMLNPIVYACRIGGFKNFLSNIWENRSQILDAHSSNMDTSQSQQRGLSSPNDKKRSVQLSAINENSILELRNR